MNDLTPNTLLTAALLREHSVCAGQAKTFATLWPRGLHCPTPRGRSRVARRLAESGLDIEWVATRVLTRQAWTAFSGTRAPALAAFDEARAPALVALNAAVTTALADHAEARALAWETYVEVVAPALEDYNEARTTAFLAAWAGDGVPGRLPPEGDNNER